MGKLTAVEAVRGLQDEILECRDANHAWGKAQYSFEERDQMVLRVRACTRCTAVQAGRIIRHTGEYMGGLHIEYPDGYLVKGAGRIRKPLVRQETIRRVYNEVVRKRHPATIGKPAARRAKKVG